MSTTILPRSLVEQLMWPLQAISYEPASLARTLARLGIRAPITAADVPALGFVGPVVAAVDAVALAARQLRTSPDMGSTAAAVAEAITALDNAVRALSTATPSGFFDADVLRRIASDLPDLILAEAVANSGTPAAVLRLLDVLDVERVGTTPGGPAWQQPAHRYRLKLDQLAPAMADPASRLAGRWGWQPGTVHGDLAVADLIDVARLLGLRARRAPIPQAAAGLVPRGSRWTRRAAHLPLVSRLDSGDTRLVETGLLVSPAGDRDGADDGLFLSVLTDYAPATSVPLGRGWLLDAAVATPLGLLVKPGGVEVVGTPGDATLSLAVRSDTPRTVALPLLTAQIPAVAATVTLQPDPVEVELRLATVDGAPVVLVLDPTFGSAFLADLMGGPITVEVPLDVAWSAGGGLRLGGGIGLSVTIPIGRQLGPIDLDSVTLGLGASGSGARLSASAVAAVRVGPLVLSVDGLGVGIDATPGDTLLPDLSVEVVPPAGIGLGVDAPGVASGGGYLFIAPDGGEFSGVFDLDVLGVGISAVGVIETQSPDVDGWSVFLALYLDVPSIPLGFGFTLNGVGGLVGLNRTLDVEALQAAVRSGALGASLFPDDPVADAPAVIETFRSMFPPAGGRTVFGPVVAIGWGSPTLIDASLGVVISVPDPVTVAVLGTVSAILPRPEVDVVAVHLDVAGVVDLGAGTLSIDASLHDSHILGFALSGDMALRADFLGSPTFLFSLGGFHPGFTPPPAFPALDRLSLAIDAGPVLQVRFESYLALTSNTVQFGAGIHLTALVDGFGIEGGTDFDALVQFSPFLMTTSLGFHVSVVAAGVDLAGVWLDASLRGPNPWHVTGDAGFKVLGIETSVHIDEEIGAARPDPAVAPDDVLAAVRLALADGDAWSAVATPARGVVLAADGDATGLVVEPDGLVRVAQRAAPLDIEIERTGAVAVGDYSRFELAAGGTGLAATGDVLDWFAPAYFFDIAPGDALSAPSFELLASGLEFGGGDPTNGPQRRVSLRYEEILRDPELGTPDVHGTFSITGDHRPELATPITRSAPTAFAVIARSSAPTLAAAQTAVVDRRSGELVATRSSWSAAHQSPAGSSGGNILCPTWEVHP